VRRRHPATRCRANHRLRVLAMDNAGGGLFALFVLLVILALLRFFKGFVSNVAVLLGIVAGAILASLLGVMHFDKVASASWVVVVAPLRFGLPKFQLVPIVTMCIVMIVVMIESTGMFLALGER
jgi:uric acid transporter